MGLTALDGRQRVYLDAVIFIYLIENPIILGDLVEDLRQFILRFHGQAFTSELTLCEVLTKPLASKNAELVHLYQSLILQSGAFEVVPTTREIYVRAALLRADFGLKTPDAIHMASAISAGCGVFLTNDARLRGPKTIEIVSVR